MPTPYAPDRVRQLRVLLWVMVSTAVLLVLVAALQASPRTTGLLALLGVPGLLLLGLAATALRLLARDATAARPVAVATGVVAVVAAVLLSATTAGLLLAVVGVPLLLIAALPARGDG